MDRSIQWSKGRESATAVSTIENFVSTHAKTDCPEYTDCLDYNYFLDIDSDCPEYICDECVIKFNERT